MGPGAAEQQQVRLKHAMPRRFAEGGDNVIAGRLHRLTLHTIPAVTAKETTLEHDMRLARE